MPGLLNLWLPRLLLGLFCLLPPVAAAVPDGDIEVAVRQEGELVRVDVSFAVAATPQEVWQVLTDFGHMQEFVSNLSSSQVLSRDGDILVLAQAGKASVGPLTFVFESVREVRLTPFELISTRQIGGNLKKFEATLRMTAEDDRTRVRHHSDTIPDVWIPPLLGRKFIESETREQFAELRQEILRRKQAAAKP